jgi:hypothetical protein
MTAIRPIESFAKPGVFLYVERSQDSAKLFAALARASGLFDEPKKNRKGQYGHYADLASLRKATRQALAENGLMVIQTFHLHGEEMVLNTTLAHSSGEWFSSQVPIKQATNPQQTTAYATYMRRMAYSAILSLSSEDDDDGEVAATAAVSAETDGWESKFKRASTSLRSAESIAHVDQIMQRVADAIGRKEMAPDAQVKLQSLANARKIELRNNDGGAAGAVAK